MNYKPIMPDDTALPRQDDLNGGPLCPWPGDPISVGGNDERE
jgi:hypothetical protein